MKLGKLKGFPERKSFNGGTMPMKKIWGIQSENNMREEISDLELVGDVEKLAQEIYKSNGGADWFHCGVQDVYRKQAKSDIDSMCIWLSLKGKE